MDCVSLGNADQASELSLSITGVRSAGVPDFQTALATVRFPCVMTHWLSCPLVHWLTVQGIPNVLWIAAMIVSVHPCCWRNLRAGLDWGK